MQNIESAKRASSAALSAACWNTTVMVRATPSAPGLPQPQATRWRFRWRALLTNDNQNGGDYAGECRIRDCAAPTFIQPRAINSSVPPVLFRFLNHRELNQSPYRQLMAMSLKFIQHAAHSGNTGKKNIAMICRVLISMICHLLSVVSLPVKAYVHRRYYLICD